MISDHSDHGASKEPTNPSPEWICKDSSVPLIHHDPNDLRSQIRFWILPKNPTLSYNAPSLPESADSFSPVQVARGHFHSVSGRERPGPSETQATFRSRIKTGC